MTGTEYWMYALPFRYKWVKGRVQPESRREAWYTDCCLSYSSVPHPPGLLWAKQTEEGHLQCVCLCVVWGGETQCPTTLFPDLCYLPVCSCVQRVEYWEFRRASGLSPLLLTLLPEGGKDVQRTSESWRDRVFSHPYLHSSLWRQLPPQSHPTLLWLAIIFLFQFLPSKTGSKKKNSRKWLNISIFGTISLRSWHMMEIEVRIMVFI